MIEWQDLFRGQQADLYRGAAYSFIESQFGDLLQIEGGALTTAIELVNNEASWGNLSAAQQRGSLGIVITLGAESAIDMHRAQAADCLIRLIDSDNDSANRVAYARLFVDGLGQLWSVDCFDSEQIEKVGSALESWDGLHASYGLHQKVLAARRRAYEKRADQSKGALIQVLHSMVLHECWLDERERVSELTNELICVCRAAIASDSLLEADLAYHLMFAADKRLSSGVWDQLAGAWCNEALSILRRLFETARDVSSCHELVDALKTASRWQFSAGKPGDSERHLREAVDAVRLLRQQPAANETAEPLRLHFLTLMEYLEPKVLTASGRLTLRSIERPEELLPMVVEWSDVASDAHAALDDEESAGWVIMASGVAALVAIRVGKREQAASQFARCRYLARRVGGDPAAMYHAMTVSSLDALSQGNLVAAKEYAGRAAQVTREGRLWSDLFDALAFQARLDRLDLVVLLEPDAEAEDMAAAVLPAISSLRQDILSVVPGDDDIADTFAQITKWLTCDFSLERLHPDSVDACVREVADLSANLESRCGGSDRPVSVQSEWMLAILSTLMFGIRLEEPTKHFDYLWELSPRVLNRLLSAGCKLESLDTIATSLGNLAFECNSFALHGSAVKLTRELVERSGDVIYRRDLAFRLCMLAFLHLSKGELEPPRELLGEALEISTQMVTQNESEQNLLELKRTLEACETFSRHVEALDQADQFQARRRAVLERLVVVSGGRIGADELAELAPSSSGGTVHATVLH